MFRQVRVVSVGLVSLVASLLLFSWSIVASGTEGHLRLDRDLLVDSRGTNTANVLTQLTCNANNGNAPCPTTNGTCFVCGQNTYTATTGGTNGGYNPGTTVTSCGSIFKGACNVNNVCSTLVQQSGSCKPAPGPPSVQP